MLLWWQWLLVALGAFLVGLSKTGIAGIGILAVAIFASVLPARESVGAVLLTLISADLVAVSSYRREVSWSHLWRLFPWTAAGVIIGALALNRINDSGVRTLIGVILIVLLVVYVVRQYRRDANADVSTAFAQRPWLVGLTGLLAGFTTMVANASGPIMVMYLLALRLPKLLFIGTAAWFFFAVNLFKVPFSLSLGLITPTSVGVSLRLIPFAIIGALFGRRIIHVIDQKLFERLALGLTLIAAIRLLL
ncbi:MAG TPA: sulfite exporter TauE/SafE family protein [Roseiflexaceae bacterium]|nr:sulfite exporter TauE/SafE family protein [Roseiflexaceae bacterium]